jgi:hypothetical protein
MVPPCAAWSWKLDLVVQNLFNRYPDKYLTANRASGIHPFSFIAPNGASGRFSTLASATGCDAAGSPGLPSYPSVRTLNATRRPTSGRTTRMHRKAAGMAIRYAFITFSK